jgi:hypothetical protein
MLVRNRQKELKHQAAQNKQASANNLAAFLGGL